MIHFPLYIGPAEGKGRGVFSSEAIPADAIVEVSPVVVMTAEERTLIDMTRLHDYIFEWTPDGQNKCCMAQGYISVYNHSYTSNCEYFMNYEEETIMIKAVREIAADEELTINYNGDWDDEKPIWFQAKQ